MSGSINIAQLIAVAEKLRDMKDRVVFVGGSTTALLVDEVAAGQARQTEDVDFIVDIAVSGDMYKFEDRMRELGFRNDTDEGAPLCRWVMNFLGKDLKVDAMPTDANVLGFSNCWYRDSIDSAWEAEIKDGLTVKIVDPVYFLGTKFEAFKGRGGGDIFSHDLEDIIYVLEHRSGIEMLVFDAEEDIKSYLSDEFTKLLQHPDLENTLPGLLDDDGAIDVVIGRIQFVAAKC